MEHSKKDKSPFNLSEDRPPALSGSLSKTHQEKKKDRTDITNGAMIWNPLVRLIDRSIPGNWGAYHGDDEE